MGVSETAFESLLARARRQLKRLLSTHCRKEADNA